MSNNNVSREALANALAVASRLSATEMRDLHALLLKGGDDVLKKTVKRSSTKRKGKKKVKISLKLPNYIIMRIERYKISRLLKDGLWIIVLRKKSIRKMKK